MATLYETIFYCIDSEICIKVVCKCSTVKHVCFCADSELSGCLKYTLMHKSPPPFFLHLTQLL